MICPRTRKQTNSSKCHWPHRRSIGLLQHFGSFSKSVYFIVPVRASERVVSFFIKLPFNWRLGGLSCHQVAKGRNLSFT